MFKTLQPWLSFKRLRVLSDCVWITKPGESLYLSRSELVHPSWQWGVSLTHVVVWVLSLGGCMKDQSSPAGCRLCVFRPEEAGCESLVLTQAVTAGAPPGGCGAPQKQGILGRRSDGPCGRLARALEQGCEEQKREPTSHPSSILLQKGRIVLSCWSEPGVTWVDTLLSNDN